MRRITWILALVLAAGVLAAGCGGDDEEEPAGGGEETTEESTPAPTEEPEATEEPEPTEEPEAGGGEALALTADAGGAISWEPIELNATAGEVSIELVNDSSIPHAVAIDGVDGASSEQVTGGTTTLTVELEAGEYVFYCPVGSHRAGGMEGQLLVE